MARVTASLLLLVAAAVTVSAAPYRQLNFEMLKRQLAPPPKPDKFKSVEQLDSYMKQLEAYLKLVGRQRFGKRSSHSLSNWHRELLAGVQSANDKLDRLLQRGADYSYSS